ncbi:hypothetical protein NG42_02205 [Winslowiella iniecta]|uniref:SET domain-containing protein n=2 Tax=Winslowiella iniecta TaxID=1560201 RepID=A0A0L7TBI4_9GAMM|nr:hypothetical protein NG43_14250 [Winslowiella iniecta]KOC92586.1 hypothetical protein NG42_02205 [Winslowiella iniecta]
MLTNNAIQVLRDINQYDVRENTSSRIPFISIHNTGLCLSQTDFQRADRNIANGKKVPVLTRCQRVSLRDEGIKKFNCETSEMFKTLSQAVAVPAGQSLLPAEPGFAPLTSASERMFELLLHTRMIGHSPQLYLGSLPPVIIAGCGVRPQPDPAPLQSASGDRFFSEPVLSAFDEALNRVMNSAFPWHSAAAQEIRSTVLPMLPNEKVAEESDSTIAQPQNSPAEAEDYIICRPGDNSTQTRQQFEDFFDRMEVALEPEQQQQLMALLSDGVIVFHFSEDDCLRPKRVHEDEMRRRNKIYEMSIKEKSTNKESIGAKITLWADEMTQESHTLFVKGTESKNPGHFLLSGGAALVGFFSRKVGETFTGEIFERQPGQTKADFLLEWGMAIAIMPETQASKAFNPPRGNPASSQVFKTLPAIEKPENNLPGTLIHHPKTGLTVHSILEKKIGGEQWHIYPDGSGSGVAEQVGKSPVRYPATHNSQTNRWKIAGIEGEYIFTYGAKKEFFIWTEEGGYRPVTHSADDGTWILSGISDGKVITKRIYFNELLGEWKEFCTKNDHLNARVLARLPEELINPTPGQQRVMSSAFVEGKIRSTRPGEEYLEVRSWVPDSPHLIEIGYVRGNLEGEYFTVRGAEDQPIYRQMVLKWQPQTRRWDSAPSPFSALQKAEQYIDSSWLQQNVAAPWLATVDNRPGLYWNGNSLFMRWSNAAEGSVQYLKLMADNISGDYSPLQPGADDMRFRYDEQTAEWQFHLLRHPAFSTLPESVRVQFTDPLSLTASEDYDDVYQENDSGDRYIYLGENKQDVAEYIRVEQDAEQGDLFSLRVPAKQQPSGPDDLYLYRYDENEEFVLEEIRSCQPMVRRGADDPLPCAGPSGIKRPAVAEVNRSPAKKLHFGPAFKADVEQWLNDHPRLPQEAELPADDAILAEQNNLNYAVRLTNIAPKILPVKRIADHARVNPVLLRDTLKEFTPPVQEWFAAHPRHSWEQQINYAVRLCRMAPDGISIVAIAKHTWLTESSIAAELKSRSTQTAEWFEQYPQDAWEDNLDYAVRLHRMRPEAITVHMIARYAAVEQSMLKAKTELATPKAQQWLDEHPRKPAESDADYALRLCLMEENGVTTSYIAQHIKTREGAIRKRLFRVPFESRRILFSFRQRENESDLDYAMRLYQQLQGKVKDKYIAIYAGVKKSALLKVTGTNNKAPAEPMTELQQQWFASRPRKPKEVSIDYARRLVMARDDEKKSGSLGRLTITNILIAEHADISNIFLSRGLKNYKLMHEWFEKNSRSPDEIPAENAEKNQHYALRLVKLRNQQQEKVSIKDSDIAAHVGITPEQLKQWADSEKSVWFIPFEQEREKDQQFIFNEHDTGFHRMRKNQLFALSMIKYRDHGADPRSALITDKDIANMADITTGSLYEALQPGFLDENPFSKPYDPITGWAPETGLLRLNLQQNPHLLTDPNNPTESITHKVLGDEPISITNLDSLLFSLRIFKKTSRDKLEATWLGQLENIIKSDGSRQNSFIENGKKVEGQLNKYLEVYSDLEKESSVGMEVRAREEIPGGTLLGIYTGVRHENDASLQKEFRKMGSQQVLTYLWGDQQPEEAQQLVGGTTSSYQNANILALINTGKMNNFPSLGKNNVLAGYVNNKIVFYVTRHRIRKGEQLLINYGEGYHPHYEIQSTLNNAIIDTIARSEKCYFTLRDMANSERVFGPEGEVENVPDNKPLRLLREIKLNSGILKYNVIQNDEEISIPIRNDDANNLYHALAVIIDPKAGEDIIEQKILAMKAAVKARYPSEEGIKQEPAEDKAEFK